MSVISRMPQLGALQVRMPVRSLDKVAQSNLINHLSGNREIRAFGHVSNTTGADYAREAGFENSPLLDGSGIGIAVLDSGIDADHWSFVDDNNISRVVFSKDFTGENRTDDPYGHGTHVAAAAAGNGRIANASYLGIAPNAKLINLRVLNATGSGTVAGLMAAIEWILANRSNYSIRVVNMSVGMLAVQSHKNDPVCRAVRSLVDAGLVVVAAAGNNGRTIDGQKIYGQIHSPGIEPAAITVGATNTFGTDNRSDDQITTLQLTRSDTRLLLGLERRQTLRQYS